MCSPQGGFRNACLAYVGASLSFFDGMNPSKNDVVDRCLGAERDIRAQLHYKGLPSQPLCLGKADPLLSFRNFRVLIESIDKCI